ncbi:hypothetical protein Amsp01_056720 [Amycolatopsis sp. NBRC 101858]|nr:hypothetical protein Amsp01_056720 [Amycolatopsis sp. NBRC 101858]
MHMPPDDDPTADFLDEVRAEETPWRRERPPGEQAPERAERPERWGRTRAAGRAAAQAAPYLQAAALVAWLASGAFDDGSGSGDQSS